MGDAIQKPAEVFGPYLVYEKLGVGGMATVHRAAKQGIAGFARVVGLKRLLPHLAEDGDFVRSFVREAKLAAVLQHANIGQIYELGRVGGAYFMSMEYLRGHDVRQILRRSLRQRRRVPIDIVLAILAELCDALDYAHTRADDATGEPLGIVHRDVSPSNLIVTPAGHLKVIDFGIAKATSELLRTETGRVKGKLAYMSPEAIKGGDLDARSDIFSAGIVAHELLSVRPLFASKTDYETLRKIHNGEVQPPSTYHPEIPVQLDDLVLKALARAPHERFPTAAVMRAQIHTIARDCGLRATNTDVANWLESVFSQDGDAGDIEVELGTGDIDAELTAIVWGARTQRENGIVVVPGVPDVSDQIPMMAAPEDDQVTRIDPGSPRQGSSRSGVVDVPESDGLAPRITYRGNEEPAPPPMSWEDAGQSELSPPDRLAAGTSPPPLFARDFAELDQAPVRTTSRPPGVPLAPTPTPAEAEAEAEAEVVAVPVFETTGNTAIVRPRLIRLAAVGGFVALATWIGFSVATRADTGPPPPAPAAKVAFSVEPTDAVIEIDGRAAPQAPPFALELPSGTHHVAVHRDGYSSWVSAFEVRDGESQRIRVALDRAGADAAHLAIESSPPGLAVAIDGRYLPDATPIEIELPTGKHRITVSDRGVELWAHDFDALANTRYLFHPAVSARPSATP